MGICPEATATLPKDCLWSEVASDWLWYCLHPGMAEGVLGKSWHGRGFWFWVMQKGFFCSRDIEWQLQHGQSGRAAVSGQTEDLKVKKANPDENQPDGDASPNQRHGSTELNGKDQWTSQKQWWWWCKARRTNKQCGLRKVLKMNHYYITQ